MCFNLFANNFPRNPVRVLPCNFSRNWTFRNLSIRRRETLRSTWSATCKKKVSASVGGERRPVEIQFEHASADPLRSATQHFFCIFVPWDFSGYEDLQSQGTKSFFLLFFGYEVLALLTYKNRLRYCRERAPQSLDHRFLRRPHGQVRHALRRADLHVGPRAGLGAAPEEAPGRGAERRQGRGSFFATQGW